MYGRSESCHRKEEMKRIIIIGYMGVGKTTMGHALSKRTGMPFYDLDWYIETRMHSSVSELFEKRGEDEFRKIERNMLHEVAEFENVIISCGGGTPCFFDNMQYMNEQGSTLYLKASPNILYEHIKMTRIPRPLLKNKTEDEIKAFISEQLAIREPYYMQAKTIFDIDLLDTREKIIASAANIEKLLLSNDK